MGIFLYQTFNKDTFINYKGGCIIEIFPLEQLKLSVWAGYKEFVLSLILIYPFPEKVFPTLFTFSQTTSILLKTSKDSFKVIHDLCAPDLDFISSDRVSILGFTF